MTPAELRRIRRGMDLSQTAFAKLVGCSMRAVSSWERGIRPIPPWLPIMIGLIKDKDAAAPD